MTKLWTRACRARIGKGDQGRLHRHAYGAGKEDGPDYNKCARKSVSQIGLF
jgi:hypothetical protein